MVEVSFNGRGHMEPDLHDHSQPQQKDPRAVELGILGGKKRMAQMSAAERSAFSKHALRARWHRRQFNEEQARAREITYAVVQALKDKQLPLV
jgi:hypothetical protein